MEKMHDLKDLLKHEILDLVSAEEQIIAALPAMIEKAGNTALKNALQQHLQITEQQRQRLDQVQQLMAEGNDQATESEGGEKKKGFIAGLFSRNKDAKQVCLGTKGLIDEGEKVMAENMEPEVMDAAIIGCAQKIEHYEICGYGTAKAYAKELGLAEVERLLEQTLNEEYEADDQLTALAVGRLNREAENTGSNKNPAAKKSNGAAGSPRNTPATKGTGQNKKPVGPAAAANNNASKAASKTAGAKSSAKTAAANSSKNNTATASKVSAKAATKSSKGAAKKGSASRGR
jgi:ferritin-like metal-binding protein YciE